METSFVIHDEDGTPVLEVVGKVGVEQLERLGRELKNLGAIDSKVSVLDLTECPFLASRVFPAILLLHQELDEQGRHLFVACREDLQAILKVLRIDQRVQIFPSRGRCIEAATTLRDL